MSIRKAVQLPESLTDFVEAAIVRLRSLHPAARVHACDERLWIEGHDEEAVRAATGTFLHLVYQERIYAQGLAVRQALYAKLLGQ